IRAQGLARYDRTFDAAELARELKVLGQVLLAVYCRRHGGIESAVAELIAELVGEASISIQRSFAGVARSEAERSRGEAIRDRVLQNLEVGVLLADAGGAISWVSPALARWLELPLRSLAGAVAAQSIAAGLSRRNARHLDGGPVVFTELPLFQALRQRTEVRGGWMTWEGPSGEEAFIELTAQPLWEAHSGSQLAGAMLTFTDRTGAARRMRELSAALDELRGRERRQVNRLRSQALGQLAVATSHTLNNLLNSLRLRLTLLRREPDPGHLDGVELTMGGLGELVSRLQEFSSVRPEEAQAEVEVDRVAREAIDLARPELGPSMVVRSELAAGARAKLDESFLRELVASLLGAARDRMPAGGELTLRSLCAGEWIDLRVEFPGSFSPGEQAALFNPLGKQGTPELSLLLAAARNQVQRWGGSLSLETQGGARPGAAFALRLPRAEAARAPVRPPQAAPAGRPRRVMVVDDDVENAQLMAELLENEGYQVAVAYNGQAAIALWDKRPFDAAVLDVLMPDLTGWQVARELRKRSPQAQLAVVTGAEMRGQSRSNLALVDAVFTKPVDAGALDEFLSREQPAAS
ncbi:MAG: response regulator, partial [Myxococcaceae bacterium]